MRVSVILPDDDVEFLDAYGQSRRIGSRSAVVRKAVRQLRVSSLGPAYEAAWTEAAEGDDGILWKRRVGWPFWMS